MDSHNMPASAGGAAFLSELPRGWNQRIVEALVIDAVDHLARSGVEYIRIHVQVDGPEGPALVESYWPTHPQALVALAAAFLPELGPGAEFDDEELVGRRGRVRLGKWPDGRPRIEEMIRAKNVNHGTAS